MKLFISILIVAFAGIIFVIITNSPRKHSKTGFPGQPIPTPFNFKTDKAEMLSIKAFKLNKQKEYDRAILLYREAIEIEPDNPKLFFDLSDCYFEINNLEQAILILDTAILLDSNYAPFYNNRGLYYCNLNKNKKGMIDLKKALQLDSSSYTIYLNLALAYYFDNNL
ncbi:MAG: tetratricopeptide repeat protein [Chitinophagaceae bacterium]|nr:tetratricopeptide repeat protein [Chitinophagaceae bacterium]